MQGDLLGLTPFLARPEGLKYSSNIMSYSFFDVMVDERKPLILNLLFIVVENLDYLKGKDGQNSEQ